MDTTIKTTVRHCSRCRGRHVDMIFSMFTNPIVIYDMPGTRRYDYWSMCPKVKEPVLLRVEQMDD